MRVDEVYRRLRGAAGNALVWGGCWSATAFAVMVTLHAAGVGPELSAWYDAIGMAARFGLVGATTGGAFSLVVGLLYRGRRLSDLSWVRFGVGGAVLAGVFVPVFLQAMNLLSGDGMVPMWLVLDDAPWAALFGGVAAGGSLRLAQRADPLLPGAGPGRAGLPEGGNPLASAGERDARRRTAPAPRTAVD